MRIRTNPILGTWEMAESDKEPWQSVHRRPGMVERNSNHILIVDNEPRVRSVFRRVLSRLSPDFIISEAKDGFEAVDLFKKEHPGVVTLDLAMPRKDGEQAFNEILDHCKEEDWELPSVIFCTGYDPNSRIRRVVAENGIHCMLHKPVATKTLIAAIQARI